MITKSIWKALRDVGLTVLVVVGMAVGTHFISPESIAPILEVTPDLVDSILLLLVPLGAKALVDYLKHRTV